MVFYQPHITDDWLLRLDVTSYSLIVFVQVSQTSEDQSHEISLLQTYCIGGYNPISLVLEIDRLFSCGLSAHRRRLLATLFNIAAKQWKVCSQIHTTCSLSQYIQRKDFGNWMFQAFQLSGCAPYNTDLWNQSWRSFEKGNWYSWHMQMIDL